MLNIARIKLARFLKAAGGGFLDHASDLIDRAERNEPLSWRYVLLGVIAVTMILVMFLIPVWAKPEPKTYRGLLPAPERRIAMLVKPQDRPALYFFPNEVVA